MTLKDINKFFVGYDEATQRLQQLHQQMIAKTNTSYPPYNLRKTEDHKYLLELAVAGFSEDEIAVEVVGDQLVIEAEKRKDDTDNLFKGWFIKVLLTEDLPVHFI